GSPRPGRARRRRRDYEERGAQARALRARPRRKAIVVIGISLRLRNQVVRFSQRLDRVLCRLELTLGDEHADRVLLRRLLDRRVDTRVAQDLLQLLRLCDVTRHRDMNYPAHDCSIIGASAGSLRGGRAPLLTSRGAPRSGNGTSMRSKSRGTTVSGKTARASSASSGPK